MVSSENIDQFLKKCRNANWAGVFYSSPFQNDFQFLLQDLNTPSSVEAQFIFHPFDSTFNPRILLKPQFKNEQALQQLDLSVDLSTFWSLDSLGDLESTDKKEYQIQFKRYMSTIQQGHCHKAILSTVTKSNMPTNFYPGEFILRLRQAYPQAFIYLFSSPLTGTWIGATPETFLKWEGNEISTMSLAGTKNQVHGSGFGEKEKQEQKIVTQYIEQVFAGYFDEMEIQKPIEFSYGEMLHLITRISAKTTRDFKWKNFMQLVQKFHPTPAVGGYPKETAFDLITKTEKHSRLYYSGYLGPITDSSAELAVNLRCMTLNEDSLFVFAGGGITTGSQMEAEWAETRLKAQALLKFL